jgi:hypothetical protein
MRHFLAAAVAVGAWATLSPAQLLTFERMHHLEYVAEYYNGGRAGRYDSSGWVPGSFGPQPAYGVSFTAGDGVIGSAIILTDSDAGGVTGFPGTFANEPTSTNVLKFDYCGPWFASVPNGFTGGFSVWYCGVPDLGSEIRVLDGTDDGAVLATVALDTCCFAGTGDPTGGERGLWHFKSVLFAGTARSVRFQCTYDNLIFDNMRFGSPHMLRGWHEGWPASSFPIGGRPVIRIVADPAVEPPSTGVVVFADLSAIGGLSVQPLYDDGSHGDEVPGDDVHSFEAQVSEGASPGVNLPYSLQDAEGRIATGAVFLPIAPSCGSADFDGDGDLGTDADLEAFFACLGGECCPSCGSAVFNSDGDLGTDADIEAFFRVLGGGDC